MPIVALFPDVIYLLEKINITLATGMGSQSVVLGPAASASLKSYLRYKFLGLTQDRTLQVGFKTSCFNNP